MAAALSPQARIQMRMMEEWVLWAGEITICRISVLWTPTKHRELKAFTATKLWKKRVRQAKSLMLQFLGPRQRAPRQQQVQKSLGRSLPVPAGFQTVAHPPTDLLWLAEDLSRRTLVPPLALKHRAIIIIIIITHRPTLRFRAQ